MNDLALTVSFSDGSRWPSAMPHAQPVLVSFSFAHDVRNAAATDDLAHSVNYSTLASGMKAIVGSEVFPSLEAFVDRVCSVYASQYSEVPSFTVRVARTKALLYGSAFGVEVTKTRGRADLGEETFFFEGILAYAVIGIHPHERQRKQRVRVNVAVTKSSARQQPLDFRVLEQRIFDVRTASLVALLRSHQFSHSSWRTLSTLPSKRLRRRSRVLSSLSWTRRVPPSPCAYQNRARSLMPALLKSR